jgi:aminoglycoside phosphotransferase (APT) family kinase protein
MNAHRDDHADRDDRDRSDHRDQLDDLAVRLLSVLRAKTGVATIAYQAEPERLTGGFWAELLAFSLADPPPGWEGQLVARVMPEPRLAAKETVVQAAVADAGVPTPSVRASGGPDDGLGRAYMVMDRAGGGPLLSGLDRLGALAGAPARLWRMPEVLATVMARLHTVDPSEVRQRLQGLEGVAVTVTGMLESLRAWSSQIGRIDLAQAAGWLLDHERPTASPVICHGDLHPFNVLVDAAGRVTVLDWSAALLGPPAYDVAYTTLILADPPIPVPAPARPLLATAGRGLARRFARRYRHYSGVRIDPADVDRYQAVVALRALVEVAQWEYDGIVDDRAGHPWLVSGGAFAARLSSTTGVPVRLRWARADGAPG